MYDKFHIFMRFRRNGSFTPWLSPVNRDIKTKGPLRELNAKAEKDSEKDKHRVKAPVQKLFVRWYIVEFVVHSQNRRYSLSDSLQSCKLILLKQSYFRKRQKAINYIDYEVRFRRWLVS